MAFDLFAWAIGFGLTKATSATVSLASDRTLAGKLNAATRKWADALPEEEWLDPNALVAGLNEDLNDRPKLEALRAVLRRKSIPDEKIWSDALFEQWALKRSKHGTDAQPFFLLPEERASQHLVELAGLLREICTNDEPLFKGTIIALLDELIASGLKPSAIGLPKPIQGNLAPQSLAKAVELETGSHVHAVFHFEKTKELWIWGNFFGTSLREQRWTLACITRLVSQFPDVSSLRLGLSAASELPGTDGSGLVGWLIVEIPRSMLDTVASSKDVPLNFWDDVSAYACAPEQTPFEHWQSIDFRSFEETLS